MRYLYLVIVLSIVGVCPSRAQELALNSSVKLGEAFPEVEYSHQLATFKEANHPLHVSAFAGYWRSPGRSSKCDAICSATGRSYVRSGLRIRYSVALSPVRVAFGGGVRYLTQYVRGDAIHRSRWSGNTSAEMMFRLDIPLAKHVYINSTLIRWLDATEQIPHGPYLDVRLGAVYAFHN